MSCVTKIKLDNLVALLSRVDAEQVVNWSIVFSVLLCVAIVAMGGVLSQFEIIPHPDDPLVYEWQLAAPTAWNSNHECARPRRVAATIVPRCGAAATR